LCDILVALFQVHVLESSDQEYSFSLTQMYGFHNEGLIVLLFVKLCAKIVHLLGQYPGFWEEVKVTRENLVHSH
jgi:hypothetical protein